MAALHGHCDCGVVADDLEADHGGQFRHDGIDLAGHDGRAGLEAWQIDLGKAGIGAGGEQPEVVGDADDFQRDTAQCRADLSHAGVRLHGPAHVGGGRELLA